jgi:hypothetical protein
MQPWHWRLVIAVIVVGLLFALLPFVFYIFGVAASGGLLRWTLVALAAIYVWRGFPERVEES